MAAKPSAQNAQRDEQTIATDPGGSTDPVVQAELQTLESLLQQPLPPNSPSDDPECQRLVELIGQIGKPVDGESPVRPADCMGEQLGQYQLLEKLGEGGMGAVYKALHGKLEKLVALKVLPDGRLKNEQAVARFEREMRAVGRLNHLNIVAAHDAGEIEGHHYLVMELVDGCDLSELVRRCGPLPVAEACEVIRQAALGLEHAWSFGMVHRDIKPGNLMLTRDGQVKVLDMGLALLDEMRGGSGVVPELTTSGQMMGTLDYMAPEQGTDSHQVDIRADVYSLGATLFKLISGQPPFFGPKYDSPLSKMMALATEPARVLSEVRADVPDELSALVARMLSKQADERPATPQEVVELLAPFAAGARLDEVARLATEAGERSADDSSPDTFAHLRSSFSPTDPAKPRPVTLVESQRAPARAAAGASVRPQASRVGGRFGSGRRVALAAGFAGLVALGVILLSLRTPHGEVVVELGEDIPAEMAQHIKIEVAGNGQVKVADARAGWSIDVVEGKYQAQLADGDDRFQLDQQQVTVTRNRKTLLRVTLKAASGTTTADRKKPEQGPIPYTPPGERPSDEALLARLDKVEWEQGEPVRGFPGLAAGAANLPGMPPAQVRPKYPLATEDRVNPSPSGRHIVMGPSLATGLSEMPGHLISDVETEQVLGGIVGHLPSWSHDESRVAYLNKSHSSSHIAHLFVCRLDGAIEVQVETGCEMHHTSRIAWSPDGTRIIITDHERAEQRRPDGTLVETFQWPERPCYAVWSPDGSMFAALDEQGRVQIYGPDGGEPLETIEGKFSHLRWAGSRQRHLLASASNHQAIGQRSVIWSRDGAFTLPDALEAAIVSPDGRHVLTWHGSVCDLLGNQVGQLDITDRIHDHVVRPERTRWVEPDRIVYFVSSAHWLEYSPSGQLIQEHRRPAPLPFTLSTWLPGEERILSVYNTWHRGNTQPRHFVWDLQGQGETFPVEPSNIHGFQFWNRIKACYASTQYGYLIVIDHRGQSLHYINTKEKLPDDDYARVTVLGLRSSILDGSSWSPDGALFTTSTNSGRVAVWNEGELFALLKAEKAIQDTDDSGELRPGPWHPNGRYLVTSYSPSGPEGQAHLVIWDVQQPDTPVAKFEGVFHGCVWSPDGRYLAVAEQQADGLRQPTLITLDGEKIRVDTNPTRFGISEAWHPDSQKVLMRSSEREAALYNINGVLERTLTGEMFSTCKFAHWNSRRQLVAYFAHFVGNRLGIWDTPESKPVVIELPGIPTMYNVGNQEQNGHERFSPSGRWYSRVQNASWTANSGGTGGYVSLVDLEKKELQWLGVGFSDGERVVVDRAGKLLIAPENIDDYLVHVVRHPHRRVVLNRLQFAARVGLSEAQAFLQMLLDCEAKLEIAGRAKPLTGPDLADARDLPPVESVTAVNVANNLYFGREADEALQSLALLSDVETLDLSGIPLTDTGLLNAVYKLAKLRKVNLSGTAVTDALAYGLPKTVEELDVSGTKTGDLLLQYLARDYKSLRRLTITGTEATDEGIAALRAALPDCEIIREAPE